MNLLDLWTFPFGISNFPDGAVLNISSIRFSSSGVNFLLTPMAFTVSSSCYTFVAPVIAVETSGLLMTQAIASWAIEQFSYLAIPSNYLNFLRVLSRFLSFMYFAIKTFKFGFLSNLLPSGIPSLYLPVKTPLANGDQTVVPNFLS